MDIREYQEISPEVKVQLILHHAMNYSFDQVHIICILKASR